MPRWEYIKVVTWEYERRDVYVNSIRIFTDVPEADFYHYLNNLGADGWEMLDFWKSDDYSMVVYNFKRQLT